MLLCLYSLLEYKILMGRNLILSYFLISHAWLIAELKTYITKNTWIKKIFIMNWAGLKRSCALVSIQNCYSLFPRILPWNCMELKKELVIALKRLLRICTMNPLRSNVFLHHRNSCSWHTFPSSGRLFQLSSDTLIKDEKHVL